MRDPGFLHWIRGGGRQALDCCDPGSDGFTDLNVISTVGSVILGISTLPFLYNVYKTWKTAPLVAVDDPWGWGGSLEWATSCPPPRHNFTSIPPIRSERPAFDLHHPDLVDVATQKRSKVLDELVASSAKGTES